MPLGEKKMVVQRASVGAKGAFSSSGGVHIQLPGIPTLIDTTDDLATDVLCLMNMITTDDLRDDEEYEDIVEDIRDECNKIGSVRSIEIPRPINGIDVPGCGKVCKWTNYVQKNKKNQFVFHCNSRYTSNLIQLLIVKTHRMRWLDEGSMIAWLSHHSMIQISINVGSSDACWRI